MADVSLISEISVFAITSMISSIVPIYLHVKFRFRKWSCSLIGLGLTLLLINGFNVLPFLPVGKSKTGEFYEVFWVIPPVLCWCIDFYLLKRKEDNTKVRGIL